MVAPSLGFERVTACLRGDPSPVDTIKVPSDLLQLDAAVKPAMATMCASHVIQDETSGVTYTEMVIASVGWVALAYDPSVVQSPKHTIEDIIDLPKMEGNNDHLLAE